MTTGFVPTAEQQAACDHPHDRHARILAGPGTGKSMVLVSLLLKFAERLGNSQIQLLTFTRAATVELVSKLSGGSSSAPRPSTVHSFALSVLMKNGGLGLVPEPLRIANDWEQVNIVVPSLQKRMGQDEKILKRKTLTRLLRGMASNWQRLSPSIDEKLEPCLRDRFLGVWSEHRTIYGYTLLSEIPYRLLQALEQHSDLEGTQFSVLIVDEYQDLNACELAVIRSLSSFGCTVICAGDDDQSIYSFKHAHPVGIRRFTSEYIGAADYTLSVVQRCSPSITEWANNVIRRDPNRPEKAPLRSRSDAPRGAVALLAFANERAEAEGVASLVSDLISTKGLAPKDILIMSRSDGHGKFSKPVRKALNQRNIDISNPSHVEEVCGQNAALLARYRLLADPRDSISWATVLKTTNGVGASMHDYIYREAKEDRTTFGEALLSRYHAGFPGAPRSKAAATEAVASVLKWLELVDVRGQKRPDWGHWLNAIGNAAGVCPTTEFGELLREVDDGVGEEIQLSAYLNQIETVGKDRRSSGNDSVRVMTMSKAKGLTALAAILIGVERGLVPSPLGDMSEERRILYVGMTRAREYLYVTWARRRTGQTAWSGQPRVGRPRMYSEFLSEGPVPSQDGREFLARRSAGP